MESICNMWFKGCPMHEASRIRQSTTNLRQLIFLLDEGFRVESSCDPAHGFIFDSQCRNKDL